MRATSAMGNRSCFIAPCSNKCKQFLSAVESVINDEIDNTVGEKLTAKKLLILVLFNTLHVTVNYSYFFTLLDLNDINPEFGQNVISNMKKTFGTNVADIKFIYLVTLAKDSNYSRKL